MKIEIESHGEKYTWESNYEDCTVYDIAEKFKGLLVSAGYHPENVDELFDELVVPRWSVSNTESDMDDELEFELEKQQVEVSANSLK